MFRRSGLVGILLASSLGFSSGCDDSLFAERDLDSEQGSSSDSGVSEVPYGFPDLSLQGSGSFDGVNPDGSDDLDLGDYVAITEYDFGVQWWSDTRMQNIHKVVNGGLAEEYCPLDGILPGFETDDFVFSVYGDYSAGENTGVSIYVRDDGSCHINDFSRAFQVQRAFASEAEIDGRTEILVGIELNYHYLCQGDDGPSPEWEELCSMGYSPLKVELLDVREYLNHPATGEPGNDSIGDDSLYDWHQVASLGWQADFDDLTDDDYAVLGIVARQSAISADDSLLVVDPDHVSSGEDKETMFFGWPEASAGNLGIFIYGSELGTDGSIVGGVVTPLEMSLYDAADYR
ncbi:hypothetical protein HOC01_00255 [archaeon]|jgi:hypothetical protein|nr:hypothetical protein [archaeon]MBT6698729.1 hypothetical protein [archaeon]